MVMEVFEVVEFESILEIEVAPFLGAPGPIFAQNLDITQTRWVVWAPRSVHRVFSRILPKDKTL